MDTEQCALAMVEAHVGPLFDVLPVPLVVADDRGIVQRVNASAAALLGGSDHVVGRPIQSAWLCRSSIRDDFEEIWLYALRTS
jgi:PAS domain-containing protein